MEVESRSLDWEVRSGFELLKKILVLGGDALRYLYRCIPQQT